MKNDSRHFFMAMENPPTATKQMKQWRVVKDKATGEDKPVPFPHPAWLKAESLLRAHLEPHRPAEPIRGGVVLDVTWCFPPKGCADGAPWLSKPDTDNLQKGLKDVMTELGWWADDSQVFSEHVTKIHSRITGIRIDIEEVD